MKKSIDYISHKQSLGGDPAIPPQIPNLAAAHKVLKELCWEVWAVTGLRVCLCGGGGRGKRETIDIHLGLERPLKCWGEAGGDHPQLAAGGIMASRNPPPQGEQPGPEEVSGTLPTDLDLLFLRCFSLPLLQCFWGSVPAQPL